MENGLCISKLTRLFVIFIIVLAAIKVRILYAAMNLQINKRHLLVYLWNKCLVAFKPT